MIYPSLNLDSRLYLNDSNGKPAIASFSRASGATCWNAVGQLTTVAAGTLRHDFDPVSGEYLGWLLEEQRANAALHSEDHSISPWMTSSATIGANMAIAPDGSLTADKLMETTANAQHFLYQNIAITPMSTIATSWHIKAAERTKGQILLYGSSYPGSISLNFDLAAGVSAASIYGGTTVIGSSITPLCNGWYRLCLVGSIHASESLVNMRIQPRDASNNDMYTGIAGHGFYVWGAQFERDAVYPSSYIATAGSAVTRAADVLTIPTSAFAFNPAEGTLLAAGRRAHPAGAAGVMASLNDTTTSEEIFVCAEAAPQRYFGNITDGGVSQAAIDSGGAVSPNMQGRIALAYRVNDCAACANGGIVATDNSAALPQVNSLRISSRAGNGQFFNGHVRHVAYFPRRLNSSDLQDITQF